VFNNFGKIRKAQYNARIYQPIGSNGDFISIAANYNVNRNNFFGSAPLRYDTNVFTSTGGKGANAAPPVLVTGALRTPGTGSSNRFPFSRDELPYSVPRCQVDTPQAGVQDATNTCGTTFDERYNPSNTGNIRISSRFTLAPNLVLTVEPSFQYVKANGGGTVVGREGFRTIGGVNYQGFIGGSYYLGRDLNGDGDILDTCTPVGAACSGFTGVNFLAPSQTVTHRYGLITSLRYSFDDNNTIRFAYSHDYGRHRQTGELAPLQPNGFPTDVFPINNPVLAANGTIVEKRDRLSFAVLDQFAAEYRGTFGGLTVNVGVRAPFFKRNLHNFCFTTSASGFVDCLGRGNDAANSSYATANPTFAAPQTRRFNYNRVLPNVGATYKFGGAFTAYINYSKGLQVPGTDNLYQSFFYPLTDPAANPTPETSDNFDGGVRYTTSKIQATISPWYTRFTNRLASAFDVLTDQTIYRNLGRVDKYGIDGSLAYRPVPEFLMYAWASYLKSDIKNDVVIGECPGTLTAANTTTNCTVAGAPIYAMTAGKRESGAPVYTYGLRLQGDIGPVSIGIQGKVTGPRYLNDQNLPNLQCTTGLINQVCPTVENVPASFTGTRGIAYQVYPAKTPAYGTVDLDARVKLGFLGLNDKTFLQLNVQNLFNKYYVGGFSGGATTQFSVPFVQIGSPRAFIGTINMQF